MFEFKLWWKKISITESGIDFEKSEKKITKID